MADLKKYAGKILGNKKMIAVICCMAAVILWLILWKIFPLEFYSLFFASAVGSNILLVMLILVISIPCTVLFSKLMRTGIPMKRSIAADIPCMIAAAFVFSVFRYTGVHWVVLAEAVHLAAVFFIMRSAVSKEQDAKRKNAQDILTAVFALFRTMISDSAFLMIMFAMAKAAYEYTDG